MRSLGLAGWWRARGWGRRVPLQRRVRRTRAVGRPATGGGAGAGRGCAPAGTGAGRRLVASQPAPLRLPSRRREAPGRAAASPPGPARPWGILGAGRGGGGPFKRRARPQGPSGRRGQEARSAPQRSAVSRACRRHGCPAAASSAARRAGLHPGLRGGAGEVQRYGAPAPPAGCLPSGRP